MGDCLEGRLSGHANPKVKLLTSPVIVGAMLSVLVKEILWKKACFQDERAAADDDDFVREIPHKLIQKFLTKLLRMRIVVVVVVVMVVVVVVKCAIKSTVCVAITCTNS